ncbi:glycoside hydrolase family 13 protein [Leifsonia sp. 22587]|uniref:glycoside hydrolase family 13 protein n=1 Tax=Leifsonia sp. 22587 TaxID=3453946 RepID=UPI003F82CFAC
MPSVAPSATGEDWWRQAAVYQIYPRSFADGNGDGIGDFAGVLSHLDYIQSLGVDAVWFSPFYPSALADGGYDIDDYRDVDPSIGTLGEFEAIVSNLHRRNIKVIIDLVPNHSSDRHERFREALSAAPGSPERARYIFRDGTGDHGELPPNDWQSLFGGPAWTRVVEPDGNPGQWYLHLFAPQQPDWNWDNQDVREDFLSTLRFWGDRGVDGFRVDVAMALAKDLREPYASWAQIREGAAFMGGSDGLFADGQHPLFDRDELDDIYGAWRRVFDTYDPPLFAVAEAWVPAHRRGRYASTSGLGQAFNFDLLTAPWDAQEFASVLRANLEFAEVNGTTSTWVLSNHDVVRHVSRYAQEGPQPAFPNRVERHDAASIARGLARARAATALALALPGSAYIYQGEELGLPEVTEIPARWVQDPSARIENGVMVSGRDGCRVPLPWTIEGDFFGFSDSAAHLPQPGWFGALSVEAQQREPSSTLALYRRALALREGLRTDEKIEWVDLGDGVVAFRRSNGWLNVTNFTGAPTRLPAGEMVFRTDEVDDDPLLLSANSTAWLIDG